MRADARAATYLVNNNGDLPDLSAGDNMCDSDAAAGLQCSLRAAIQEANTDTDKDFINFNIPGPGVQKIKLADFLPSITNQVDIDGYTQPGASPNTKPFGKPLDTEIRIELIGKGFFFDAGSTSSEVSGSRSVSHSTQASSPARASSSPSRGASSAPTRRGPRLARPRPGSSAAATGTSSAAWLPRIAISSRATFRAGWR